MVKKRHQGFCGVASVEVGADAHHKRARESFEGGGGDDNVLLS